MFISSLKSAKNIKGKHVLLRVDFNVPIKKNKVEDVARLKASLPTLEYLRKKGSKVILVTHLGRPEGKPVASLTLAPVAKKLAQLWGVKVKFLSEVTGPKVTTAVQKMKNGEVIMFENVRFDVGEEKNDPSFARELASLADLFVLDGFAVAHRAAASVSGVAKYVPSFSGLLLQKEIEQLNTILHKPKHPYIAIIGGAKIETKLPVVKNVLKTADKVLLGGAIVNTFWSNQGYGVGASLVDEGVEKKSLKALCHKKVVLPVDVIVGDKQGKKIRVVEIQKKPHQICLANEAILDIGPETLAIFVNILQKAKTVVWNGAMGYFEVPAYATGTFELARSIAAQKRACTLLGGGETLLVMEKLKLPAKNYFVSTGGGAMLEYLSGKKLPGILAVQKK